MTMEFRVIIYEAPFDQCQTSRTVIESLFGMYNHYKLV